MKTEQRVPGSGPGPWGQSPGWRVTVPSGGTAPLHVFAETGGDAISAAVPTQATRHATAVLAALAVPAPGGTRRWVSSGMGG